MKRILLLIAQAIGKLPPLNLATLGWNLLNIAATVCIILFSRKGPWGEQLLKYLGAGFSVMLLMIAVMRWKKTRYPSKFPVANEDMLSNALPEHVLYALMPGGRGVVELYPITFDTACFHFVADEQAVKVCSYNEIRRGPRSTWINRLEPVRLRNLAHYKVNNQVFLQYKQSDGLVAGHSHMVPINARVQERLLKGDLRVDDFHADLICRDENFTALVLLAVIGRGTLVPRVNAKVFFRCVVYHLTVMMGDKAAVDLVFPSPSPEVTEELKRNGYSPAAISKDGYELFVVTVDRFNYQKVVSMALRA